MSVPARVALSQPLVQDVPSRSARCGVGWHTSLTLFIVLLGLGFAVLLLNVEPCTRVSRITRRWQPILAPTITWKGPEKRPRDEGADDSDGGGDEDGGTAPQAPPSRPRRRVEGEDGILDYGTQQARDDDSEMAESSDAAPGGGKTAEAAAASDGEKAERPAAETSLTMPPVTKEQHERARADADRRKQPRLNIGGSERLPGSEREQLRGDRIGLGRDPERDARLEDLARRYSARDLADALDRNRGGMRPWRQPERVPGLELTPEKFGEVITMDRNRGFGFIRPNGAPSDASQDLFFHFRHLVLADEATLRRGTKVAYKPHHNAEKEKMEAVEVHPRGKPIPAQENSGTTFAPEVNPTTIAPRNVSYIEGMGEQIAGFFEREESRQEEMEKGTLIRWNPDRDFGLIRPEKVIGPEEDLCMDSSKLAANLTRGDVRRGDKVAFVRWFNAKRARLEANEVQLDNAAVDKYGGFWPRDRDRADPDRLDRWQHDRFEDLQVVPEERLFSRDDAA